MPWLWQVLHAQDALNAYTKVIHTGEEPIICGDYDKKFIHGLLSFDSENQYQYLRLFRMRL